MPTFATSPHLEPLLRTLEADTEPPLQLTGERSAAAATALLWRQQVVQPNRTNPHGRPCAWCGALEKAKAELGFPRSVFRARLRAPLSTGCDASTRYVIASSTNAAFLPFALRLARDVATLRLAHAAVFFAEDEESFAALSRQAAVSAAWLPRTATGHSGATRRGRNTAFLAMMQRKLTYVLQLLRADRDALYIDADTTLLCNPLPYLANADVAAAIDAPLGVPSASRYLGLFNSGLVFVRSSTDAGRAILHELRDVLSLQYAPTVDDQRLVNLAVERVRRSTPLRIVELPPLLFSSNGVTSHLAPAHACAGVKHPKCDLRYGFVPVAQHYNGDVPLAEKLSLAREDGWLDGGNASWDDAGADSAWVRYASRHRATLRMGCEPWACPEVVAAAAPPPRRVVPRPPAAVTSSDASTLPIVVVWGVGLLPWLAILRRYAR